MWGKSNKSTQKHSDMQSNCFVTIGLGLWIVGKQEGFFNGFISNFFINSDLSQN